MNAAEVEAVLASDERRVMVPIDFLQAVDAVKSYAGETAWVNVFELGQANTHEAGRLMGVANFSRDDGSMVGGAWVQLDSGKDIFASFESMSLPEAE